MDEFIVGDWVIAKDIIEPIYLGKIVEFLKCPYYVKIQTLSGEFRVFLSSQIRRKATVLDYVRAMDEKQIAMFVYFVNTKQKLCQLRCDVCPTVNSIDRIACFLRQTLTEESVKQLGEVVKNDNGK